MCGIAGTIDFNGPADKLGLLRRMIGLMRHRGPDSVGVYTNGPVGLGHARLSIIDLVGGDQPIHNENNTIWIVFNGEIFNYPELRIELISRGHRFYTQTDTEVLIHLYEEKGVEMFHDLNGQFAFAMWDQSKETLLLGRDRVGIRPLFFCHRPGQLVFGSEIKAIFADNTIPRKIDPHTLSDIFTCWAPLETKTSFEGIEQLPPGHYAIFSKSGIETHRYWTLSYPDAEAEENRTIQDWSDDLNFLLKDSTKIRLRADVPVGAYLSGGIDSSYISALVKQNFNNRICTFSVGFEDKRFDESKFQKMAVASIGTDHKEVICSDSDIGEIFPQVIWHTETPMMRTAPAPLLKLSKLVRESNYKVVLTGEGADEIFAGYDIFKEDKVRRFWSHAPESKIRPMLLKKLYPDIFLQENERAQQFLFGFFRKSIESVTSPVYSHLIRWQNTTQLKNFFSPELSRTTADLNTFIDRFTAGLPPDFMRWHPLSRAQYIENKIFLSNYLLSSQGDRMSMANSIEGRYPFLDYRVIEFACRIPHKYRMRGLEEKYILKKAADGLLPPQLIQRPKKPYRAPISSCFFGEVSPAYVALLLSEEAIKSKGYFDHRKVARIAAKCIQNRGQLLSERENMALVAILSTQLLDHLFIRNFPAFPIQEPENVKVFPNEDRHHS